jgi:hypothetical protein
MGLIYDNPDLAALTLTRLAAEESEGPGALEGRMLEYLGGLEQRNGTAYLELVAITPLRAFHQVTLVLGRPEIECDRVLCDCPPDRIEISTEQGRLVRVAPNQD